MTSVSEEIIPHPLGVGMPPLTSTVQTPPLLSQPVITPEPKYNLVTFNVTNIQSLAPMLSVNAQVEYQKVVHNYLPHFLNGLLHISYLL